MAEYDNLDYAKLLDSCFEIEGLLTLMKYRETEAPEEIYHLLRSKVKALALEFGDDVKAEDTPDIRDTAVEDEEIAQSAEYEEAEDANESEDAGETLESRLAREGSADLRTAFSLNDKFRFRRELFGNSEAEFRDTLVLISAMHSLSEAEDYLYGDLHWDPSGDDVKDFMAIIANHFNGR